MKTMQLVRIAWSTLALAALGCGSDETIGATDGSGGGGAGGGAGGNPSSIHIDGSEGSGQPCTPGVPAPCYRGPAAARGVGVCRLGSFRCELVTEQQGEFTVGSYITTQCEGSVLPGSEACNGKDDDCDGQIDEGCACTPGQTQTCGAQGLSAPCRAGVQTCSAAGQWGACEGAVLPASEACGDKVDNDCDGKVDEGCAAGAGGMGGQGGAGQAGVGGQAQGGAGQAGIAGASGGSGGSGGSGQTCDASVASPRLLGPASTGRVTTWRPTFRWALPDGAKGARLTLCHDRSCSSVIEVVNAVGSSAKPASPLAPGVVFWKVERDDVSEACPSATWELTVGPRDTAVDTSWGTQLDVNGDGYADLAVGSAGTGLAKGDGGVYVYLGGPGGLPATPDATLVSPNPTSVRFAESLASAGDVNGDGYADLVVGSAGSVPGIGCNTKAHTTDEVYIYLGGPGGLTQASVTTIPGPNPNSDTCTPTMFGFRTQAAGDVNGDGYGDVLVGQYLNEDTLTSGLTWIFYGSAAGLDPSKTTFSGGTHSVRGLSGAGDINGDGFADVVVGSMQQGSPAAFMGSPSGLITDPVSLPVSGPKNSMAPIGAGDTDGDGYADIVLAAGGGNKGSPLLYVHRGGPSGPTLSPVSMTAEVTFSSPLLASGDSNADGYSDLMVWTSTLPVTLRLGSPTGLSATPGAQIDTGFKEANDQFNGLSGVGDINRDGYVDFAASGAGVVKVYFGGSNGVSTSAMQTVTLPASAKNAFSTKVGGSGAGF